MEPAGRKSGFATKKMVSLRCHQFIETLSNDPVVRGFAAFLLTGEAPSTPVLRQNDRQRITLSALHALAAGDSSEFSAVYEDIQRRRISEDSDWIFDNYLLFALACAAVSFSADRRFLANVLGQRRSIQPSTDDSFGRALESFLNDPKAEIESPLIFVAKQVSHSGPFKENSIRKTYRHAVRVLESKDESEFNRLISLAAVGFAFDCSSLGDTPASILVQSVRTRVRRVALGIFWTLLLLLTVAWGLLAYRYFAAEDTFSRNAEKIFTTGLAITPVAALLARKRIVRLITSALLRMVGLPSQHAGSGDSNRLE